jgi:hypothetical protein
MAPDFAEMSDAEKLAIRAGLAERVGALMGAWWLGMYRARDEEERELLAEVAKTVTGPDEAADGEPGATRLGLRGRADPDQQADMVRLSDEEYLEIFDQLTTRYVLLRNAFRAGMVVAEGPEQRRQLEELREVMDEGDDPA